MRFQGCGREKWTRDPEAQVHLWSATAPSFQWTEAAGRSEPN